jgi:hypothetical protein
MSFFEIQNLKMPDKEQPGKPVEIPGPVKIPEVPPYTDPGEPVLPEKNPEIMPDKEPFENPPPIEIPPPAEGTLYINIL